jgi:hypothetical protein
MNEELQEHIFRHICIQTGTNIPVTNVNLHKGLDNIYDVSDVVLTVACHCNLTIFSCYR